MEYGGTSYYDMSGFQQCFKKMQESQMVAWVICDKVDLAYRVRSCVLIGGFKSTIFIRTLTPSFLLGRWGPMISTSYVRFIHGLISST